MPLMRANVRELLGEGPKFRGEISLGNTVVRLKRRRAVAEEVHRRKNYCTGSSSRSLSASFLPLLLLLLLALFPPPPFPRARDLLSGMPISATRGVTYPRSSPRVSFFSLARPKTRTRTTTSRRLFRSCVWRNLSYASTRGWVT